MVLVVEVVRTYALKWICWYSVDGVGVSAAWDWAILLQCRQFALVACMSFVMPGQKIEASALAVIAEVPWWAACRAERHVGLSEGGMTMRSL